VRKRIRREDATELGKRQKKWAVALTSSRCSCLEAAKSELCKIFGFVENDSDDGSGDDTVVPKKVMGMKEVPMKAMVVKSMTVKILKISWTQQ